MGFFDAFQKVLVSGTGFVEEQNLDDGSMIFEVDFLAVPKDHLLDHLHLRHFLLNHLKALLVEMLDVFALPLQHLIQTGELRQLRLVQLPHQILVDQSMFLRVIKRSVGQDLLLLAQQGLELLEQLGRHEIDKVQFVERSLGSLVIEGVCIAGFAGALLREGEKRLQ